MWFQPVAYPEICHKGGRVGAGPGAVPPTQKCLEDFMQK